MSIFRDGVSDEDIEEELQKASLEGVGQYLVSYGPDYDMYSPAFIKKLEAAKATLELIENEIIERGCEV